jgi:hypothetical protein
LRQGDVFRKAGTFVGRAASLPVRLQERAFKGKLAAYPTVLKAPGKRQGRKINQVRAAKSLSRIG